MQESKKASRYSNRTGSSLFLKKNGSAKSGELHLKVEVPEGLEKRDNYYLFFLQRYLFCATNHLCPEMHVICCKLNVTKCLAKCKGKSPFLISA